MADTKDDKSTQAYSALGIGLVCIVIGLPLWWKTTEVYRVQLPYAEIYDLETTQVSYSVDIHVVIFTESSSDGSLLSEFEKNLKFYLNVNDGIEQPLDVTYNCFVRSPEKVEQEIAASVKSITDLDVELDQLRSYRENGNYTIYVLPSSAYTGWIGSAVVGPKRAAFVKLTKDESKLLSQVVHIVKNVFVNEAVIAKTFQSAMRIIHMQADKESMRSLRSSLGYDVTFTLLNPQPDMVRAMWDIKAAIDKYLKPLMTAFIEYADIKMKSQYLHLTGLGVVARRDSVCNCSMLSEKQLPHIINPIEPYLGSHISNNPNLNFVLYIPTRDQSPLKIFNSQGEVSVTNAFLSPRWGGLMVYNIDTSLENATLPIPVDIDMKKVMSVFASQLRVLLGIQNLAVSDDVSIIQPGTKIISDWELDLWLREHCIENIAKSTSTLSSLAGLLDRIGNIVINDDIGKQVADAVTAIRKSRDLLAQAKLKDAFLTSKKALESSEKAFFDPSLLELLYFPEDQKFAIYIPLFLPVGIPIILSMLQAIKYLRNKSKEKKE